jgi:DNA-binding NtrC family response regulator
MKILVMDELKSRKNQIGEGLEKNKHKVTLCSGSNEFIAALEEQSLQCICLDYETWHNGRSIYTYFKIQKKFESIPTVVYNAPAHFSTLTNRAKHEKDQILPKPADAKAIIDTVTLCQ